MTTDELRTIAADLIRVTTTHRADWTDTAEAYRQDGLIRWSGAPLSTGWALTETGADLVAVHGKAPA